MTILERQPDGSWRIHRDIFNLNVAGGASGAEKVDSVEDMVGAWGRIGMLGSVYHLFFEDGTFHCSSSLEHLEEQLFCKDEFWLEGTRFFDNETQPGCDPYDPGPTRFTYSPTATSSLYRLRMDVEAELITLQAQVVTKDQ